MVDADNQRADRLTALLLAVAPRVSIQRSRTGAAHSLCISLLAFAGAAPHSVAVQRTEVATQDDCAFYVHMEGPAAPVLMLEFAKPLLFSLADTGAALQLAVQMFWTERMSPRCGQPAMLIHAGNMLFIGLLRHMVAHPKAEMGLFTGLNDPRIAKALVAMHANPQSGWSVASLAGHAGMSRTLFATQFKSAIGTPPGRYLTQLRLLVAQRAVQSGKGLKEAARQSGYKNASALSRTLGQTQKKVLQITPVNA